MTSPVLVSPEPLLASTHDVSLRRQWTAALLFSVAGLLLVEPLALGGTEPWGIFMLEALAATVFLAWVLKATVLGDLQIVANPLFAPMALFAVLCCVQWTLGLTAYRHVTGSRILLFAAYGMIAFVLTQTLRRRSQAKQLAVMVTVYGSAMALFALVQSASSNGRIYWAKTPEMGGWIYGPYVNHNHYAGLMEMLVPVPLVFCLSSFASGNRKWMAALAAMLMGSTIFLSGSRGGMIAFVVELAVLFVAIQAKDKRPRTTWIALASLVALLAMVYWLGGREFTQRLISIHAETHAEISGGTRLSILRDGLHMWWKRPIAGWGLGTFSAVYPGFRSYYTNFFINQAHNDYLQCLIETGAAGFLIMGWFLFRLHRAAWKKMDDWAFDVNGAVALAAMMGVTGILVHSFFDFNLQIPANAALFYALAATAAAPSFQQPSEKRRHRSRIPRDSWEPLEPVAPAAPDHK